MQGIGGILSSLGTAFAILLGVFNTLWLVFIGMRDRKKVSVRVFPAKEDWGRQVRLAVSNTGRRPVTIVSLGITSKDGSFKHIEDHAWTAGDELPTTVGESDWRNYWVNITYCRELTEGNDVVKFVAEDAAGIRYSSSWHRLDKLEKSPSALTWIEFTDRYPPKHPTKSE